MFCNDEWSLLNDTFEATSQLRVSSTCCLSSRSISSASFSPANADVYSSISSPSLASFSQCCSIMCLSTSFHCTSSMCSCSLSPVASSHNNSLISCTSLMRNSLAFSCLGKSVKTILEEKGKKCRFRTSLPDLNFLLGGGFEAGGGIYDICGLPGTGKTQLCLQLCADVQLPKFLGGLEGKAIYIDTEGSFVAHRFKQIAENVKKNADDLMVQSKRQNKKLKIEEKSHFGCNEKELQKFKKVDHDEKEYCSYNFNYENVDTNNIPHINYRDESHEHYACTTDGLIEGLTVLRVYDIIELQNVIKSLFELIPKVKDTNKDFQKENTYYDSNSNQQQNICQKHDMSEFLQLPTSATSAPAISTSTKLRFFGKNVKLIVIDSLSFHLRYSYGIRMVERASHITQIGAMLNKLSILYDVIIIVTNHMTTKLGGGGGELFLRGNIVPALGDFWSNIPYFRILTDWGKQPCPTSISSYIMSNNNNFVLCGTREGEDRKRGGVHDRNRETEKQDILLERKRSIKILKTFDLSEGEIIFYISDKGVVTA